MLLLSYILLTPTLALSTLISYIDKVDKLYFKRETAVKSSIGRLE